MQSGSGEGEEMRLAKSDRFSIQSQSPNFLALPGNRKKPKAPKVTIKEKDLQSMAENLCNAIGRRFFRIPDKLMGFLANFAPPWVRVFVARYFQGVPDMMLFKPIDGGDNIVRFIEIKTEAGKVSQGQSKWHSGLNVHVCYGWEQTEKAIKEFE
jgi:hypothetical protein